MDRTRVWQCIIYCIPSEFRPAIERIEVLKGGGATVYGADAVGGVVNIITKKAQENMFKIDVNTGSWGTQNYKGVISQKQGKTGVFISAAKEKQNYMKYI